jgi:hypothetical protein
MPRLWILEYLDIFSVMTLIFHILISRFYCSCGVVPTRSDAKNVYKRGLLSADSPLAAEFRHKRAFVGSLFMETSFTALRLRTC